MVKKYPKLNVKEMFTGSILRKRNSIFQTNGGMEQVYKLSISLSWQSCCSKASTLDGGWIFTKDAKGRPWMSVACQGLGASVWYPCKDYQGDEPNAGACCNKSTGYTYGCGNGKLIKQEKQKDKTTIYSWWLKIQLTTTTSSLTSVNM
jgi:hypothetical protein